MKTKFMLLISALLVTAAVVAPVNAAKVETISLWACGEEGRNMKEVLPDFEKEHPNIKVKLQVMPWGAANTRLLAAVAGGTVPDVAQMGSTWMAQFADAGALEELTLYLKRSKIVKLADFFPAAVSLCTYKGKTYGIPWYCDTRIIFYRPDLLESVGFKEFPGTWDEMLDCARKFKARGEGRYFIFLAPANYQVFMPFVWANGGRFFDEKGNVAVAEPAFIEALTWYATFFKENLCQRDTGGASLMQLLASGTYAAFADGYWFRNLLDTQTPQIKGKYALALMPKRKTRTSFMGGCELVIFRDAKHKDAAWKFIEFMSRPGIQEKWRVAAGALPANKAAWEFESLKKDPLMPVVYQQLQDAEAPPMIPQWTNIEGRLQSRWQEAVYGTRTPEEALKLLEQDIKKIMQP